MGIQGLIPFLEKASRQVNVAQYSGCTVALDAYCWLHKGTFSCADKLARGDKTDAYVTYCMKYVNMLLSHNIKPILVFDGRHLPAKAETEKKRRQNREMNKRRAAELLRQDKPNEARTFLQRCVDVTHTMAVELMRECRARNVDCITAPYEADAQLAYLNLAGIAHIVITEDSDLLLFGCTKVIFKLDLNGNGLLVEQDRLHLAMGISQSSFSLDRFRHMCILSGCDYLPSLPKIGLGKACRFIKSTVDPDIHRALSRLGGHLNMNIVVPLEYRNKFMEADAMFRHQPVFDPLRRKLVPLTPPAPGAPPPSLLSQEPLDESQLQQLALGNLDPFTLAKVDDWSPDKPMKAEGRSNGWNARLIAPHKSIWSADYKPQPLVTQQPDPCQVKRSSTSGRIVEKSVEIPKLSAKRPSQTPEEELNSIRSQFGISPQPTKKPRQNDEDILDLLDKTDQTPPRSDVTQPQLLESPKKTNTNPFTKTTPSSANKFSGLSKLAQFRRTPVSESNVQSRYFNSQPVKNNNENESKTNTLKDLSNVLENQVSETGKTHAEKHVEKLSDGKISSLIEDSSEDIKEEKVDLGQTNGKENCSDPVKPKHENSFKWKPSLADMFGFKSKSLPSTPSVQKSFVNPSKNESDATEEPDCSQYTQSSVKDIKPTRRNPFAKVEKLDECIKVKEEDDCSSSLGSQGLSLSPDSQSDVLTPDTCSEESTVSVTPRRQLKVGLSKRHSTGCQKSLLSMFAYKPRPKLQR